MRGVSHLYVADKNPLSSGEWWEVLAPVAEEAYTCGQPQLWPAQLCLYIITEYPYQPIFLFGSDEFSSKVINHQRGEKDFACSGDSYVEQETFVAGLPDLIRGALEKPLSSVAPAWRLCLNVRLNNQLTRAKI